MEVITTHQNADFDSLASMIAAKKLYPDAVMVFPGSQEKILRDFLRNNQFIQIDVVSPKEIDIKKITRLILVDTRQPGRIGPLAGALERKGVEVHIYDHHPPMQGDLAGDVDICRKTGATTTVMIDILREKGIEVTSGEATVMMMALHEETGSFTFVSTTEEDFRAASFLLTKGANLNMVSDWIIKEMTPEQVSLLNDMLQAFEVVNIEGIDIGITHILVEEYKGDVAFLVHKLRDMEGLDVLFALAAVDNRLHLIARSRIEEVDAGDIAAAFGGGGHHEAASASISSLPVVKAKERLIEVLRERVRGKKRSADIMSSPVKTISSAQSINDARKIMDKFSINTLPVMDENEVVGLITRDAVSRAAYHGLSDETVTDYMDADLVVLGPDEPLSSVREAIIERNQRAVMVMHEGMLAGIISKTDILRLLHYEGMRGPIEPHPHVRRRKIGRMLKESLPARVLEVLADAGGVADSLGYGIYAVGGFVRDIILGYENLDIDLVVEGDGIAFAKAFAGGHDCRVKSHEKFGTAVIVFPDGFKVDIATARLEYYERPGVLPTVERGSIKLDLYRRDFTINTLAVRLNPASFGELLDFYGAQRDIKDGVIRVLHNLSFVEDPTRVFRGIRFEQRFSFRMSRHTLSLIANTVRLNFFDKLSGKRLFNELKLILAEDRPVRYIHRMSELGLLRFIHPGLRFGEREMKLFDDIRATLDWYSLLYTKERCDPWLVYLMGLIDPLRKRELEEFCLRLSVPSSLREKIVTARNNGAGALRALSRGGLKNSEIYHILRPLQMEALLYITARGGEEVKKEVSHYMTHLMDVRTELTGNDLKKEHGMVPGPSFRKVMEGLLDARLDGIVKSREDEAAWIRKRKGKS